MHVYGCARAGEVTISPGRAKITSHLNLNGTDAVIAPQDRRHISTGVPLSGMKEGHMHEPRKKIN